MQAKDIMTLNVITVRPETAVSEIAKVLIENRISAVPVVGGDGRLVGLVSEGDLMRRPDLGTEPQHSWWLRLIESPTDHAVEYARSHGLKARDVMTSPVVTVSEDSPVAKIAAILEKHRIKRVPVVSNGKVVGLVSRVNLIQALAGQQEIHRQPTRGEDRTLRQRIVDEIANGAQISTPYVNVIVTDGIVELYGAVGSASEKKAVRIAAESIAGNGNVNDNLSIWSSSVRAVLWAE